MSSFTRVTDLVNARPDAVAVIVRGTGGAFCAGADLSVVSDRASRDPVHGIPVPGGREADLLAGSEVPLIAVVDGPAVGLGMGLALSCDICIVEPTGYFAEAHLALGLAPTAMCWWIPRMAGMQRAADIILTGRRVDATEAVNIGLAARLAPAGGGVDLARSIADDLARMPRTMTRFARRALALAQDQQAMADVRQFGGFANRVARLSRESGDPPTP